jgi:hypothetical protein
MLNNLVQKLRLCYREINCMVTYHWIILGLFNFATSTIEVMQLVDVKIINIEWQKGIKC